MAPVMRIGEILSTGSTQVTDLGDGVGRWSPGWAFLQQLIDIKRRLVEQHPDNELLRDYDPTRAMPGRELVMLFQLVQLLKDGLAEATPPRGTSDSLVWRATRRGGRRAVRPRLRYGRRGQAAILGQRPLVAEERTEDEEA